jgi:SAM-dependent methyltransferase
MNTPILLNLGCGLKTAPTFVDIDWSPSLRAANSKVLNLLATPFLSSERKRRIGAMVGDIRVHNLSKGIPYPDNSVDAVYHSHLLEHIDREFVPGFFAEIRRVLKPGGLHRICVPDLENLARSYLASLEAAITSRTPNGHERSIEEMIEQSVRREADGTSKQPPLRRAAENFFFGDARKRGETHQWMYDRVNLPARLREAGFTQVRVTTWNDSEIPGWVEAGLERGESGSEYKPGCLYVESRKA